MKMDDTDGDNFELTQWECIGGAILIVVLTLLTVAIIAGGAGWLYGMLEAL